MLCVVVMCLLYVAILVGWYFLIVLVRRLDDFVSGFLFVFVYLGIVAWCVV